MPKNGINGIIVPDEMTATRIGWRSRLGGTRKKGRVRERAVLPKAHSKLNAELFEEKEDNQRER